MNTKLAKSLKESGIITEHTSNKLVCLEKNTSKYFSFYLILAGVLLLMLVPGIPFIDMINTMLSSHFEFGFSEFILFLFLGLILLISILGMCKLYITIRNYESILETLWIFTKDNAEIVKHEKTDKGNTYMKAYRFDEVGKLLIVKKIYSESSDDYHVFIQLLEGTKIPILSDGFYEKRPALDLAECINQFMNLPPDSIEITHEVIG
jgi:hypothetical protein